MSEPDIGPSAALPYPEDQGRTHYEGCWRDRGHHNCAVAEVERLREKNQELNRRCTALSAGVAVKIEETARAGHSLGRSLANAGYTLERQKRQNAEAEVSRLTAENHRLRVLDQGRNGRP